MAYATQSDLVDKFGELELIQLTDFDTPAAGGIVASRVDAALARASGVVDSYLAARYQLPLAEVPPAIQGAVLLSVVIVAAVVRADRHRAEALGRADGPSSSPAATRAPRGTPAPPRDRA